MYAHNKGVKTINYYLRQQIKSAVKFAIKTVVEKEEPIISEGCAMCE